MSTFHCPSKQQTRPATPTNVLLPTTQPQSPTILLSPRRTPHLQRSKRQRGRIHNQQRPQSEQSQREESQQKSQREEDGAENEEHGCGERVCYGERGGHGYEFSWEECGADFDSAQGYIERGRGGSWWEWWEQCWVWRFGFLQQCCVGCWSGEGGCEGADCCTFAAIIADAATVFDEEGIPSNIPTHALPWLCGVQPGQCQLARYLHGVSQGALGARSHTKAGQWRHQCQTGGWSIITNNGVDAHQGSAFHIGQFHPHLRHRETRQYQRLPPLGTVTRAIATATPQSIPPPTKPNPLQLHRIQPN
mmetsp:Transcript_14441/g.31318  ORF Transcript_14441/g.31318 Transcript_14441/m.31318 type:complete len:305 (+) Transcript_14441:550-1464(+)